MHCSFSVIWRATGLAKPREGSCVTPLGRGAAGPGHSAPPLTIQRARKTQELNAVNRGSTIPRHVLMALRRKPAREPGELGTWLWDTPPRLISPALLQGFHRENWSPSWISEVPALNHRQLWQQPDLRHVPTALQLPRRSPGPRSTYGRRRRLFNLNSLQMSKCRIALGAECTGRPQVPPQTRTPT